ncbi:MAG: DUF6573 family protein [Gallionella sp.]
MTTQTTPDSKVATPSVASCEAHQTACKTTTSKGQNTMQTETLTGIFGPPIHAYSRVQAIEDGILVDVSTTAREAGFRYSVAMTRTAWADCVEWSDADSQRQCYQDEAGRLWDVLWMSSLAAQRGGEQVAFEFYRIPRGGRRTQARLTTLHMTIGPGDTGGPVITIMLPGED